jgi:hypothetical protein
MPSVVDSWYIPLVGPVCLGLVFLCAFIKRSYQPLLLVSISFRQPWCFLWILKRNALGKHQM